MTTPVASAAAAGAMVMTRKAWAKPKQNLDVGIVGAGLAGLQCAYELSLVGTNASLYEASNRVGGRQFSLRGLVPGQVAERGGELVDNLHKTMLGWANTLGLTREDMGKAPGDIFYFFDGQLVPESAVVDEYRAFVAAMRVDLRAIARKAIEEAYIAEYGRELSEQSALNFLLFIHADKRSKFTPFGVFSDERFHIVEGNDKIASGIGARLPKQPEFGMRLEAVKKTAAGRYELSFRSGNKSVTRTHDKVVLALPFSVLRTVSLDASLQLPAWKKLAINELGYGDNAKMMIGFQGPVWVELGSNGASYSDLANHQNTWETSPTTATTAHAILTDYSGGTRGKNLNPSNVQQEANRFLTDLDRVYAGAKARALKTGNNYVAHLEHWPSNPLTRGSYTCYLPGQFTTIAENEGAPVGNLFFAGEHTNSFYEWQGYMEGALLSGITAANQVLR